MAQDNAPWFGTVETGKSSLHVLVFQNVPGFWVARGLEHDIIAEARTIGEALRAIVRLIDAHSAFDSRHNHAPLSAFHTAPQSYWNAFTSGTTLNLSNLGVDSPAGWQIVAAISLRGPLTVTRVHDPAFSRSARV